MSRFTITLAPGAARSQIVGRHGDGWKARVAARPERGRANAALVQVLADALRIPREHVSVVAGHTARRKVVEVEGLGQEEMERRLDAAASG